MSVKVKLIIVCMECGAIVEASFEGERIDPKQLFAEHGWFQSCVDKRENEVVMAPLCEVCATKVYPPELLAAAKKELTKKELSS